MSPVPRRCPGAVILLALLLLSLLCSGCRSSDSPYGDYLTLRLSTNPTTLDPALITDVPGGSIAAKLFNGLVRFDENLRIIPDLAESWTIAPDRRKYIFRIRKGVRFSNGREVTSQDFRYSFERVLNRKTRAPLTWVLDRIEGSRALMDGKNDRIAGISTPDDRTLIIRLSRPFAPFLALLGMPTAFVVPQEEVVRRGTDFGAEPVGTGPFRLQEWTPGRDIVLEGNKEYFGGKPRLRGIRYRIIPEDLTAVVEFETGRLDMLPIPASEFRRYTSDEKWKPFIQGKPGLNCYYLGLNNSRPPFSDLRMRQAVSSAIDRKKILDTIYEGRGTLASGPVPPALRTSGTALTTNPYPYDPERARSIIEASGWKGKTITILISAEPEVLDVVEVIQQYLMRVGLEVTIKQLDWSAFRQAVNQGEGDAFWLSWWADYPDAENFLFPLFHSANIGPGGNRSRYNDPIFDQLIEAAQTTVDEHRRTELYEKAEQRVTRAAPWVFLWNRADYMVIQPWIAGYRIPMLYSADKGIGISKHRERAVSAR